MKKLVIIDHLGKIVHETDVYLEGQDSHIEWGTPTPIWLGSIHILDLDTLENFKESLAGDKELAETIDNEAKVIREEAAGYNGKKDLEPVEKEEESNDSKEISDKSIGDKGASETKQSESLKESSAKSTRRKAHSRSKRVRNTPTT